MKKTVILYLIITLLYACKNEQETEKLIHDSSLLPKLSLNVNLNNFSTPVQNQFVQRISYIKQIKKQYKDQAKYGWAIGQLCKTFQAYQLNKESQSCYLNAIFYNPENIEWPYLLAHVYKTVGKYKESEVYFKNVLKLEDDVPSKIWLSEVLIEQNQFNKANEIISSVLGLQPNHSMALYMQSLINENFESYESAIKALKKILESQPQAHQVHYKLGQIYSIKGDETQADYHFSQVSNDRNLKISIQFDDPYMQSVSDLRIDIQSVLRKAIKASSQGHQRLALEILQKLKKEHPERVDIKYNIALIYLKMKNLNKAKNLIEGILDNNDDKFYSLMAKINKLEKKYDLSIKHIDKALHLKPENAFYLSELASIYALKKDFPKAIEFYKKSLAIDSEQELIQLKLVRILLQNQNNFDLARKILKEKVLSKNFNITKQNILARINIHLTPSNIALPNELNNEISMNYETKAMLAFKNNNISQAIVYQQKALEYSKTNKSRVLIKSRLENYQKNIANPTIWFINEGLIYE